MSARVVRRKRSWEFLKYKVVEGYALDYEEKKNEYKVFVMEGNTKHFVNLFGPNHRRKRGHGSTNAEDYADFVTNYRDAIDADPPQETLKITDHKTGKPTDLRSQPAASDGKLRVLASHKPVIEGKESFNYFTSVGDVVSSGIQGGDARMQVEAVSGTPSAEVDIRFMNCCPSTKEVVYVFGGAIGWENAGWGDTFNFEIHTEPSPVVPKVVADTLSLPVDYKLDGDKICYAGPGAGTHALGGLPVFVPAWDTDGHWDLDKVNMVPVPVASGTGHFNWWTTEQKVGNYISELLVYGTNYVPAIIDATEAAPLPYGHWMRLKINNNSNSDWKLWGWIRMYRERLK